jgi:hypothetical protein
MKSVVITMEYNVVGNSEERIGTYQRTSDAIDEVSHKQRSL